MSLKKKKLKRKLKKLTLSGGDRNEKGYNNDNNDETIFFSVNTRLKEKQIKYLKEAKN